MLPKIHLGTLMTVTDAHLVSQARDRKRATMEARMSRNTEGFHVYQAYLKRLRRMHRAYVTKFKQQQQHGTGSLDQQPSSSLFDIRGNYVPTHTIRDGSSTSSNNKSRLPSLNHRLSLPRPLPSPIDAETPDSLRSHQSCDSGGNKPSPQKGNKVVSGPLCSIHIPCGREDSFDLTNSFQRDTKIGNNSNDGALPFRMWKQRRDQSGTTSVYSQNYVSTAAGMVGPKHRVALNLNKPVSRTGMVTPSKWLTKIE